MRAAEISLGLGKKKADSFPLLSRNKQVFHISFSRPFLSLLSLTSVFIKVLTSGKDRWTNNQVDCAKERLNMPGVRISRTPGTNSIRSILFR